MNWNRLALVTAPAAAPLVLATAKAHLGIDFEDQDGNLQAFIDGAVAEVDGPKGVGLALITQTWRLSLDAWPRAIAIPLRPVQTVDEITYVDPAGVTQTLAADQYAYDLDREPLTIYPAETACWPALKCAPGVVKVTFTAGFGDAASDVPADLVGALKLIVGHRFEHRGDDAASDAIPAAAAAAIGRYGKTVA